MLLWDPSHRPTARDCLNHAYFADMRKLNIETERAVDLKSVPNYIGPNHDSVNILKRNNSVISNAI
jgi:hypothetical protein